MQDNRTNYSNSVRHRHLADRYLGRHIIERIEAGYPVAQHITENGTVCGTDYALTELIWQSKFPLRRIRAAQARLKDLHPGIDFDALETLAIFNFTPREEEALRA
jgi:hypothetical protein